MSDYTPPLVVLYDVVKSLVKDGCKEAKKRVKRIITYPIR